MNTPPAAPAPEAIVVIGASLGGVDALLQLARALPRDFPAPVAIVLHIGLQPSILPELLARAGARARHPRDGDPLVPGTVYVAPTDHHLLVERDCVRLSRAARENHTRPAIDPLFRTAALAFGPAAVGVVLTGHLDDGTAGLAAIKACGGIAIVQDPDEAIAPDMPRSALQNVEVDHCAPLAEIVPLLQRLLALRRPATRTGPPEQLVQEQAMMNGDHPMENLAAIATPTQLTCPECGGTLSEVRDSKPLRYRCHTGHAFTARTLENAQAESTAHALQASLRALKEREMLLRRMAAVSRSIGEEPQAQAGLEEADRVHAQARRLAELLLEETGGA